MTNLLLRAIGLVEAIRGRPSMVFRKYRVAPRLGNESVRRRLLRTLRPAVTEMNMTSHV